MTWKRSKIVTLTLHGLLHYPVTTLFRGYNTHVRVSHLVGWMEVRTYVVGVSKPFKWGVKRYHQIMKGGIDPHYTSWSNISSLHLSLFRRMIECQRTRSIHFPSIFHCASGIWGSRREKKSYKKIALNIIKNGTCSHNPVLLLDRKMSNNCIFSLRISLFIMHVAVMI